jgi:hypothetical protein
MNKKKGCVISISILFVVTLGIVYWVYDNWDISRSEIVDCPPFDTTYFAWFPYKKGDTILFESNKEIKEYIVNSYTGYHKNNYEANTKCGDCTDGISLFIVNVNDSLNISFQDFIEEKNTPGLTLLFCNGYPYIIEQSDSLLQINLPQGYLDMPKDTIFNVTIKKSVGIISLNRNHEIWRLRKHKKNLKAKSVEIKTEDCY